MAREQSTSGLDPARYDDVRIDVRDGVGVVTIDRPPRNALVPTTMLEVRDAIARMGAAEEVRCIIVTGAGDHFSLGADLSRPGLFDEQTGRIDRGLMKELRHEHRRERELRTDDVLEVPVPLIAAINGSAAGAGLALALQADIRVVDENAKMSFSFAQRGITPEVGATWLLPRIVGLSMALELMMTGRRFDGREAVRIGFASRAVPKPDVMPVAMEIASTIASDSSPLALAVLKRMLWAHSASPSYVAATRREKDVIEWITTLEDAAEGMRSFIEKRKPEWTTSGREDVPGFVPTLFERVVEDY